MKGEYMNMLSAKTAMERREFFTEFSPLFFEHFDMLFIIGTR